jgi:hypothetical protein
VMKLTLQGRRRSLKARLRAAIAEVAEEMKRERWSWAHTWGIEKAKQAVMYFGCDPSPSAPWAEAERKRK